MKPATRSAVARLRIRLVIPCSGLRAARRLRWRQETQIIRWREEDHGRAAVRVRQPGAPALTARRGRIWFAMRAGPRPLMGNARHPADYSMIWSARAISTSGI